MWVKGLGVWVSGVCMWSWGSLAYHQKNYMGQLEA